MISPKPYYDNPASSLGGGAVGLAVFGLHRMDCFPVDGAVLDPDLVPSSSNPILMRHYGPVTWDAQAHPDGPYKITRRNALDGSNPTDETACFTQSLDPSNGTIVRITPIRETTADYQPFMRGFEYVVERRKFNNAGLLENVLRSNLPSGANPPRSTMNP